MSDPLARGAAHAPQMIGEGCTRRYDPDALTEEDGAEFAEAAALWQQLQQSPGLPVPRPATPDTGEAG
jgi:hypothetical protein